MRSLIPFILLLTKTINLFGLKWCVVFLRVNYDSMWPVNARLPPDKRKRQMSHLQLTLKIGMDVIVISSPCSVTLPILLLVWSLWAMTQPRMSEICFLFDMLGLMVFKSITSWLFSINFDKIQGSALLLSYLYVVYLGSIRCFWTIIKTFTKTTFVHQKCLRFHQFLMSLLDDFKSMRNQLLNHTHLLIVNQVVNELVREEIHLKSHFSSQPHTVLATSVSTTPHVFAK